MLRQAVRTVLADAGGRQPPHEAWGLVLMAAGVDATEAAGLPARLGYVFHLGRWTESDVAAQLEAWGDALRVRAEPDVAAVVDRAAASLREQLAADPGPPQPVHPARAHPAPVHPSPAPVASPAAPPYAPPPPAPTPPRRETRRETRREIGERARQQARHQPRPPQGPPQQGPPQQRPPQRRPQPGVSVTPRGTKPRGIRLAPVVGIGVLVLLCGCSLFGFVADLFSGSG